MKLLITGGAGFIGNNLVDHFLAKGNEIVVLDDIIEGVTRVIDHPPNNNKINTLSLSPDGGKRQQGQESAAKEPEYQTVLLNLYQTIT